MTHVNHEMRLLRGKTSGRDLPLLILEFVPHDLEAVEFFSAVRVFLSQENGRHVLVDEKGHEYIGVPWNAVFEAAAAEVGGWSLLFRTTDAEGVTHARSLAIAYPGGQVLHDTGVRQSRAGEPTRPVNVDEGVTCLAALAAQARAAAPPSC